MINYAGGESVFTTNGNGVKITKVGQSVVSNLILNEILLVP